jgi:hypothetical protein
LQACESSERLISLERATASEPGDAPFFALLDVEVLGDGG